MLKKKSIAAALCSALISSYTLKVTAKDQAGNVTTKALRFEVKL